MRVTQLRLVIVCCTALPLFVSKHFRRTAVVLLSFIDYAHVALRATALTMTSCGIAANIANSNKKEPHKHLAKPAYAPCARGENALCILLG
eukprot:21036-Heterococcus_DN1.PRE.3